MPVPTRQSTAYDERCMTCGARKDEHYNYADPGGWQCPTTDQAQMQDTPGIVRYNASCGPHRTNRWTELPTVEVSVHDLRVGDRVVSMRDPDWSWDKGSPIDEEVIACTDHKWFRETRSFGWFFGDRRVFTVQRRPDVYANPETAKKLRDYLTATCRLDL